MRPSEAATIASEPPAERPTKAILSRKDRGVALQRQEALHQPLHLHRRHAFRLQFVGERHQHREAQPCEPVHQPRHAWVVRWRGVGAEHQHERRRLLTGSAGGPRERAVAAARAPFGGLSRGVARHPRQRAHRQSHDDVGEQRRGASPGVDRRPRRGQPNQQRHEHRDRGQPPSHPAGVASASPCDASVPDTRLHLPFTDNAPQCNVRVRVSTSRRGAPIPLAGARHGRRDDRRSARRRSIGAAASALLLRLVHRHRGGRRPVRLSRDPGLRHRRVLRAHDRGAGLDARRLHPTPRRSGNSSPPPRASSWACRSTAAERVRS